MREPVSLLPQNATPLMRAVSLANADRRPIAPADLAALWDPMRAPAAVLPYLAAAHGVAVWRPEWTDDRKREVIARTIVLKRRRGTIPCFEGHLAFVDAELLQVIAAPQISVARNSLTPAERTAWLAQFPELRVYHFRTRTRRLAVMTPGRWPLGRLTPRNSVAAAGLGQRVAILQGGVERPATIVAPTAPGAFDPALQVGIPNRGRRLVLGPASAGFLVPLASDARERLYTLQAGSGGPDSLRPGLRPIEAQPVRVSGRQAGLAAAVAGQAFAGPFRFLQASRAREGIYDSFRLFDPALARSGKIRQRAGLTVGYSRLGQPAFHLELAVDLSARRRKARRLPHLPGFVENFDPTPAADAMAAIRSAKLGRDKIEVRTALHRRITAGDGVPLNGTVRLGQIIRSL